MQNRGGKTAPSLSQVAGIIGIRDDGCGGADDGESEVNDWGGEEKCQELEEGVRRS